MNARRTPIDTRKGDLAQIHTGKKRLGLDDETYRGMLFNLTGKTSSADMDDRERFKVILHLRARGGLEDNQAKRKNARPGNFDQVLMFRKVEALLLDARPKRTWEYARATAEQMFGVAKLEWLSPGQQHSLVAALQADANRRAKKATTGKA